MLWKNKFLSKKLESSLFKDGKKALHKRMWQRLERDPSTGLRQTSGAFFKLKALCSHIALLYVVDLRHCLSHREHPGRGF